MSEQHNAGGVHPGPLAGIVVADFSRVLAGPYCTMLLADLGARVIKVESPGGDDTRGWSPPELDGAATYFLSVNRNKESVVLDFADPGDLELAHELAATADVVIENFKPGGLKRFGLDYDAVVARNPSVVYASISGFGDAGGADLPGYDLLIQAASGLMHVTGEADGAPTKAGFALFDVITGLHTAVAVVSALLHRQRTGEGQLVTTDLLSAALSGMVNVSGAAAMTGVSPRRMGNEHPSIYPYAPFDTADGVIVVAVGNDAQFARLCGVIGRPELAADPRFRTNRLRNANRDALRELLSARLRELRADALFAELRAAGVPAGPVLDVVQAIEFAASIGLDPVVPVGDEGHEVPTLRNPVRLSRTPVAYRTAPPGLGEDSESIRAWLRAAIASRERRAP